ncbi:L,D-transpeptidase [Streptomyces sp. NPDC050856]|uniref:L,D-transpeptidase n=1 Tax=Streptomyces sp. NPDC050856 TaxID=3154939 RepID=UPI0034042E79
MTWDLTRRSGRAGDERDEERGRRGRAVGAGLVTVAVLGAVAVGVGPAAVGPAGSAAVVVTVDAGAGRVTAGRAGGTARVMGVVSGELPAGRMTVTGLSARRGPVRWVVELAGPGGAVGRLGAAAGRGTVGLRDADARWLYGQVAVGDAVEVR